MDRQLFIEYAKNNLVSTHEARQITEQSLNAFKQSVRTGKLIPALEIPESDKRIIRLFFRDDVVAYKDKMADWQAARKK